MPTPVTSARQCLTPEAASALDEAVSLARRRSHAQTMSLHAVSALCSLPNSSLRQACAHARNSAYSPRLQFKALELSLNVSLDRLPSARPPLDQPPVSNSLMAAIKRSQSNQRPHLQNYHHIQLRHQSGSALSCIKVELQHLILAMLDDPAVSRVFREAGFRSCDVKMAIIRPLSRFIGYSRSRVPPLFLYDLHENAMVGVGKSGPQISASSISLHRTICEVLVKNKARNPLLVGVSSYNALKTFTDSLVQKTHCSFPVELYGMSTISIEKELSKFATKNCEIELLKWSLEGLVEMTDESRFIIDIGDLHSLIIEHASSSIDSLNHIILQVTKFLAARAGKSWLIGSVVSYEMYMKFVAKFPSIENDWDLQLLPITAQRSSSALDPYSRPSSLIDSFIPLGGFFSTPGVNCSLSSRHQNILNSYPCETKSSPKAELISSVVVGHHHISNKPSWLKLAELDTNNMSDSFKVKNGQACLNPLATGTPKKSLITSKCLPEFHPLDEPETSEAGSSALAYVGFHLYEDKNKTAEHGSSDRTFSNLPSSFDFKVASTSNNNAPLPLSTETNKDSLPAKLLEKPSNPEHFQSTNFGSPNSKCPAPCALECHSSPSSATSVTTTLGLGIAPSITPESKSIQFTTKLGRGISGDLTKKSSNAMSVPNHSAEHASTLDSSSSENHSYERFKILFTSLSKRFPHQKEAVGRISKMLVCSRIAGATSLAAYPKGGVWIGFLGPDSHCKKKVAAAVAEILWGEHGNFVCVDLSSSQNTIDDFEKEVRGKTAADYIALALNKKPFSVVFLENVDKADVLVRNILSRAVRTGKFSDSHGRDVATSNAIFFAASGFIGTGKHPTHLKEPANLNEMRILREKGWALQIVHGLISFATDRNSAEQPHRNKRKLMGADMLEQEQHKLLEVAKRPTKQGSDSQFDLNLPAVVDDNDMDQATCCQNLDGETYCQSLKLWLEDFMSSIGETVEFEPFDFDGLAEKLAKQMTDALHDIVGSEHVLEIDTDVMDQIVAVAYTSDNPDIVEEWIKSVFTKHLADAQIRYDFSYPSVIKFVSVCNLVHAVEKVPFLPPSISLS